MFPASRLGSRTKGTALPATSGEGRSPLVWRLRLLCLGYRGARWNVAALIKPTTTATWLLSPMTGP